MLPWLAAGAWFWAAACVPSLSNAKYGFEACLLLPGGAAIALAWVGITADLFLISGFGTRKRGRAAVSWGLVLVALGGVAGLSQTDLLLTLRLEASEAELLAAGETVAPYGAKQPERLIGLFRVGRIERSGDGGVGFETAPVFLDSFGLLYLPPDATPPDDWTALEPLTGHWYRGFRKFVRPPQGHRAG